MIKDFKLRKKTYKNKTFLQKIKWFTLISVNFLLSLSIPFLPKAILFSIIRVYANLRFYTLIKNNKVKNGKQKYNLLAERTAETTSKFRFTENRISKTSRKIDRSLRTVVMDNRKQMKPTVTDEKKGLQILAQGQ